MFQDKAHIYEGYESRIGSGNHKVNNGIGNILSCIIAMLRKFLVLIMWFNFPNNQRIVT